MLGVIYFLILVPNTDKNREITSVQLNNSNISVIKEVNQTSNENDGLFAETKTEKFVTGMLNLGERISPKHPWLGWIVLSSFTYFIIIPLFKSVKYKVEDMINEKIR